MVGQVGLDSKKSIYVSGYSHHCRLQRHYNTIHCSFEIKTSILYIIYSVNQTIQVHRLPKFHYEVPEGIRGHVQRTK